jgi:hypothetical protein
LRRAYIFLSVILGCICVIIVANKRYIYRNLIDRNSSIITLCLSLCTIEASTNFLPLTRTDCDTLLRACRYYRYPKLLHYRAAYTTYRLLGRCCIASVNTVNRLRLSLTALRLQLSFTVCAAATTLKSLTRRVLLRVTLLLLRSVYAALGSIKSVSYS